jgi:hypothetical protein
MISATEMNQPPRSQTLASAAPLPVEEGAAKGPAVALIEVQQQASQDRSQLWLYKVDR